MRTSDCHFNSEIQSHLFWECKAILCCFFVYLLNEQWSRIHHLVAVAVFEFRSFHPFYEFWLRVQIWMVAINRKSKNGNGQGNQGNLFIQFGSIIRIDNEQWGLPLFYCPTNWQKHWKFKWFRTHSLSAIECQWHHVGSVVLREQWQSQP